MVACLAGKESCVKYHTCVVIYIEPGIIMIWIQKSCVFEKGIHPGKKQMEMRKNIRQLFFLQQIESREIHYFMRSFFVSSDIY